MVAAQSPPNVQVGRRTLRALPWLWLAGLLTNIGLTAREGDLVPGALAFWAALSGGMVVVPGVLIVAWSLQNYVGATSGWSQQMRSAARECGWSTVGLGAILYFALAGPWAIALAAGTVAVGATVLIRVERSTATDATGRPVINHRPTLFIGLVTSALLAFVLGKLG